MLANLTPVEYEIFMLLVQEPMLTNKQIALMREKNKPSGVNKHQTTISEHTVASHVRNILEELDITSRYLLQQYAIQQGLYCPKKGCACVQKKL